jgi:hypothetical protein
VAAQVSVPPPYQPLDSDGDAILDSLDNCRNISNTLQTDSDGDGVGDICDNCPDKSNTDQAGSDNEHRGYACEDCIDKYPLNDDQRYYCDDEWVPTHYNDYWYMTYCSLVAIEYCSPTSTTISTSTSTTTTISTTTTTQQPIVDSDGDGWSDSQEISAGTNPEDKDTDDDGYWDPNDPNPLDPNVPENLKDMIEKRTDFMKRIFLWNEFYIYLKRIII